MQGMPSTRKLWTQAKVWAAVKDLPETAILGVLCSGALGMGIYTCLRGYLTPVGDNVPSKQMRRDLEAQMGSWGQEKVRHSIFWKVGQISKDEDGIDIHVPPLPSNRAFPHEYDHPLLGAPRPGMAAEGPPPAEY